MESNTIHRAADTITELLKAHLDEGEADVDLHDAMAVRDDTRELAREMEDGSDEWNLPERGDVLHDPESPTKFGDGMVRVMEVLGTPASQTYVRTSSGKQSVAWMNKDHPEDAPVVRGEYVDGSNKVYSFPCTRLKEPSGEKA